jgi:hypothetical protein
VWTDGRLFCLRISAALSSEAQQCASDNLSTKCSGFALRSSLSIWRASARHRFSAPSTAAFSLSSRLSNSSDILRSDISAPSKGPIGRLLSAPSSNQCRQIQFQSWGGTRLANDTRMTGRSAHHRAVCTPTKEPGDGSGESAHRDCPTRRVGPHSGN